ncbi:MAG: addiction module protein [Planctomycetia bacterium]|nr:addiction module protein [Planctomycetia bacterium]
MMVKELGIDRLSVLEKLTLIEEIWDSLPENVQTDEIPEWHQKELAKRLSHAKAFPHDKKPWREALARYGEVS